MAYKRSFWQDHVTDQEGTIIQQGTLLDEQHFNNMEKGVTEAAKNKAKAFAEQLNDVRK